MVRIEKGLTYKEKYVDNMIDHGLIDSLNTMKSSIEDAVSVASLVITTEVIIYKELNYDPPPLDYFKNKFKADTKARIEAESKFYESGEKKEELEELRDVTRII